MKIEKLGEFGLIDQIKKKILSEDRRVFVNVGDDAAVLRSCSDKFLIFTTDTMVQGIHFDPNYCTFEEIGWKAMAANLSDVAAMGGLPTHALVTIGLPRSMQAEQVLAIYKGASRMARKHDCRIIGGDTTLVPRDIFISIALLGQVEKGSLVTRDGARTGDIICVTGSLGEAQAGLEYLKKHGRRNLSLVRKHLKPEPRISEARILVKNLKVNSMIDVSDGLSSELLHLTQQSSLGAVIYEQNLPISSRCTELASLLDRAPLDWALSSGEEYELLFTVDKRDQAKIAKVKSKTDISVIGEMVAKRRGVRLIRKSGKTRDLKRSGFVHF